MGGGDSARLLHGRLVREGQQRAAGDPGNNNNHNNNDNNNK